MLDILLQHNMLHAGTRLNERYEILSPLGAGGMGVVYRARDLRLDREVAVKILPDHLLQHREAMSRFEREAKALAALSHANILSIFDFASDKGVSYAVTELLKGETLRAYLSSRKPSVKDILQIASATAAGLAAAHSQGVIHRDLKPENVFLTSDGTVKILDFGLARMEVHSERDPADTSTPTATETQAGVIMGTLPYMSPEQVRGQRVDIRTDIFSFGSMLYEMLTGSRAFSGSSQADIVASVLKEDPLTRDPLPADLPPVIVETVARCLRKDPGQRFQSARDLTQALQDSGESGQAPALQFVPRRGRFFSARSLLIGLVLGIVAVAASTVYRMFPARREVQSLAVLPFQNGTNDPETEYLSDGITMGLINSLSQLPNLRVLAHDTVFTYKGKQVDLRKVAEELNVEAIVTGKVDQHGKTLVIYANLVKVPEGTAMWGDVYNKTLADIIVMQTDISREISGKLRDRLTGEEQSRVTRTHTANSEAYDLYLKAEYFFWKFTREDFERSAELYRQAIEKDPKYAAAYAKVSDCYSALAFEGYIPTKEAFEEAAPMARRALELDPSLSQAHLTMSALHLYEWNWRDSEREIEAAIRLDPSRAENYRFYSELLRASGRWEEAIKAMKKAQELDPLSVVVARTSGITYFWSGKYDLAIQEYQRALELDVNRATIHDSISDVYAKKGMYRQAIEEKQRLLVLSGDQDSADELGRNFEKYGYDRAMKELLQRYLEVYLQAAEEQYVSPLAFAVFYTELGEKDRAFKFLEDAYQERAIWLINLKTDPQFERLRSDPRFADLVKRIGIP